MARDKDRTKTSEDRLVELSPRALKVLKRQLALRARLKLAGQIQHEELFFKADGEPIRNLQYPWIRWRSTLHRLKMRYRDAVQRSPLLGELESDDRQEPAVGGQTARPQRADDADDLRRVDEGVREKDIEAIKRAMESSPPLPSRSADAAVVRVVPLTSPEFGTSLAPARGQCRVSRGKCKENYGGERGIRTLEGLLTLTPLAGVRLRPLGHLSGWVSRTRKDKASPPRRKAEGLRRRERVVCGPKTARASSQTMPLEPLALACSGWAAACSSRLMRSKISSR